MEYLRNLAAHSVAYTVDDCHTFEKSGPVGCPECMICATCGCNRNFHKKEELPTADHHPFLCCLATTFTAPLPPLSLCSLLPPQPQPPVAPEIREENKLLKKRKNKCRGYRSFVAA
ncbi:hypothetical protein Acr_07g0009290 [Actinidia rufa]|uniref:ZF-HD dimerization-type domain-containing protein n=1 Tax=Actinidia rufa TaxID=165716 RepID=A0A7J0EWI0_9ERIC|nr:hypothetical protein Acr_07g0009290 [Actinidia rufa]